MFTIHRKQLKAMLLNDEQKFMDFLIRHLQRECRDSVRDIDSLSLREMVTNGLERARGYGLSGAKDLVAFVAIMFEIAPNFDDQRDIKWALLDKSVPLDQRFQTMLERVPGRAWEEAERNKTSEAWFPELTRKGHPQ